MDQHTSGNHRGENQVTADFFTILTGIPLQVMSRKDSQKDHSKMQPSRIKTFLNRFRRLIFHLKVLAGTFLTTLVAIWVLVGKMEVSILARILPLVFIQLELFLWMGTKFFPDRSGEKDPLDYSIKHVLVRLLLFYLSVLFIAILFFLGSMVLNALINGRPVRVIFGSFLEKEWKDFLGAAALGFLSGTILFFYFQWREALKREEKLRQEKLIFRYETLRSQVNPHFLFNSLNTLASLVESHPATAGDYVTRLAAIYRYILEKTGTRLGWPARRARLCP